MGGIALQLGQNTQRIAPQVKQRQTNPHNENEHVMPACKHAMRCTHFAAVVLLKYGSMRSWHIEIGDWGLACGLFPYKRRRNVDTFLAIVTRRTRMQGNSQTHRGFFDRHCERGFVDILNFR